MTGETKQREQKSTEWVTGKIIAAFLTVAAAIGSGAYLNMSFGRDPGSKSEKTYESYRDDNEKAQWENIEAHRLAIQRIELQTAVFANELKHVSTGVTSLNKKVDQLLDKKGE